jgi:N-methylhydantoinase A/oxoprolinase/acetone carboxylase beta subunit
VIVVGVDVGGTFTDAVLVVNGTLYAAKVATTANQADGVLEAIERVLAQANLSASDVERFAHGTTVATNALLQRSGAEVTFVTTEACRDVLRLGRQERPNLLQLERARPEPPTVGEPIGVRERMGATDVLEPLTPQECQRVADLVAGRSPQAVAICFLHAWRDTAHEERIASAIREALPEVHVVASHEISRDIREYERASTTVIDAHLTPVLAPYVRDLALRAEDGDLPMPLVMMSSGGLGAHYDVAAHAATAVLSGPAGGLVAAQRLLDQIDSVDTLLCMDTGGTSCDVAVVGGEQIERQVDSTVDGLPLQLPMVDIHTVGAGGSSIARVDAGGVLRVGPASAGSIPGPAAYGRGGVEPTVTDAHLVLGNLNPATLNQWGIDLDVQAARHAIRSLDIGPVEEVAAAIVELATVHMAEAARVVTAARGTDPAEVALLAYGGAGALHACDVADLLGCRTVLVSSAAGVLSAAGLAIAPSHTEHVVAVMGTLEDIDLGHLASVAADLSDASVELQLTASQRYAEQTHTIDVSAPIEQPRSKASIAAALEHCATQFVATHAARNTFTLDTDIETVRIRLTATVQGPQEQLSWPVDVPTALDVVDGRIDLPHGTVLVPDSWQLSGTSAGCIVLTRSSDL